jgi:hypothetical protein
MLRVTSTLADLQAALEAMPKAVVETFPVAYDGRAFQAVQLAGPEAVVGIGALPGDAPAWDWKADPYGPGTLAYEQRLSPAEAELMEGRWALVRVDDEKTKLVETLIVRKDGVFRSRDPGLRDVGERLGDVPADLRSALDLHSSKKA